MSRTKRSHIQNKAALRSFPRNARTRAKCESAIDEVFEVGFSLKVRQQTWHNTLPNAWDDIVASSYFESKNNANK